MKKLSLLLMIGCIGATISCKKEVSEVLINSPEGQSLAVMSQDNVIAAGTSFGVWPHDSQLDQCISEANDLGVNYVRSTILVKRFGGKDSKVDQYLNKGFKVVLNL